MKDFLRKIGIGVLVIVLSTIALSALYALWGWLTAPLYILPRQQQTTPINIKATPRIGITKATTKQWRFLLT